MSKPSTNKASTDAGDARPQSRDESATDRQISAARRTLQIEARALDTLADALDGDFTRAIGIIRHVKGRVIVTGMGKSGHVARKIAATLASTGTPAFFVHPGEASHGDLGMIASQDAVIALSNSGETPELTDIVAYSRRFGIPLIGITSKAGSTLAQQADAAILLPALTEACPMGMAPTTSTTAMMALGDALAIALLEERGFSANDFHVFHPGGKLGQRLLKIADIMHSGGDLPLVNRDTAMSEALLVITEKSLGCVGVVENGTLAGIITDGDLRRHMAPGLLDRTVGDIMTIGPKTIRAGALAAEAVATMNEMAITSLFVVDDGDQVVGLVHIHDCLRAGVA